VAPEIRNLMTWERGVGCSKYVRWEHVGLFGVHSRSKVPDLAASRLVGDDEQRRWVVGAGRP